MTQAEVAAEVGIVRSHLSKIENGADAPGRALLSALAAYYGVTMDYLESGATPPDPKPAGDSAKAFDEQWIAIGRALLSDPDRQEVALAFLERLSRIGGQTDRLKTG